MAFDRLAAFVSGGLFLRVGHHFLFHSRSGGAAVKDSLETQY